MGKDFGVSFCLQITCLMQFGCGMYRSFVWQRSYCNPNQSKVCFANTFSFAVLFGIQIYYVHTEIYSPKRRERSFH